MFYKHFFKENSKYLYYNLIFPKHSLRKRFFVLILQKLQSIKRSLKIEKEIPNSKFLEKIKSRQNLNFPPYFS